MTDSPKGPYILSFEMNTEILYYRLNINVFDLGDLDKRLFNRN
jgi:hypothetical protein